MVPSDLLKFTEHLAKEVDTEKLKEQSQCNAPRKPMKVVPQMTVNRLRYSSPDSLPDDADDRIRRDNPALAAEYDIYKAAFGGDAPPLHKLAVHVQGQLELVFD